jgi:enoyl-CoA hydratase
MNTLTCFTLSTTAQVAHLVLNKPEALNTMHPTFWRELDTVLAHLHQAGTARALVISSTGKHFSAGMALETFGGAITMDDQSPEGRAAIFDLLTDMQATFTRLENLRIPVIMAIHGGCIGGAVDMVTAACIRYATQDAFFCIQEINIGMVADIWTPRISQALTHCCQEGKDCTRISGLVVARATVPDGNRWWRSYRFNALQVPRSYRISSTTV